MIVAIAASSHSADSTLPMDTSETIATRAEETTRRIRATLDRRIAHTPSTTPTIDHTRKTTNIVCRNV